MNPLATWQFWALGSAVFAALTAILAKIGIENVNSDFATFIRTIVILVAAGAMVLITNHWQAPATVDSSASPSVGPTAARLGPLPSPEPPANCARTLETPFFTSTSWPNSSPRVPSTFTKC